MDKGRDKRDEVEVKKKFTNDETDRKRSGISGEIENYQDMWRRTKNKMAHAVYGYSDWLDRNVDGNDIQHNYVI